MREFVYAPDRIFKVRLESSTLGPPLLLPSALLLFVAFGIGPNTLLAILAITVLIAGGILLWRPGEMPILLFAFGYQWLQASIAIFYANALEISFADFPGLRTQSVTEATVLDLLGLLTMAVALRYGAGAKQTHLAENAKSIVSSVRFDKWIRIYVGFWLVSTASQVMAIVVPGLSQIVLAIGNLKWAGYLIFSIAAFSKGGRIGAWLLAFGIEFILSFGGFFSGFKEVFFYTFIAAMTVRVRISAFRLVGGAILAVFLLGLGVVWTAIKPNYRSFLNGGQQTQTVIVSFEDSIEEFWHLMVNLDNGALQEASKNLILRISYVEFFGAVLDAVPNYIPHEGGTLWLDAVSRPFMPRLFFPEKAALDDSVVTNKYTGITVAGSDRGTSISIGYMSESYIDFGEYGMMLIIFVFWYAVGRFYFIMLNNKKTNPLAGMALVCPVLMIGSRLEISLAKMVGGIAVYALVASIVLHFVIPKFVKVLAR